MELVLRSESPVAFRQRRHPCAARAGPAPCAAQCTLHRAPRPRCERDTPDQLGGGIPRHREQRLQAAAPRLASGYNINVATTTLDSAGGRVFRSFTRGGGMGLDEMTGSPNLVVVPDPSTFRVLPWAPGVGWILCDEYFRDGTPFHFSPRHLLRRQIKRLGARRLMVGLEVEWYLARTAESQLSDEHV